MKKKREITIYYDPRENPKVEVLFLDPEIAKKDASLFKANYRASQVYSMIYNILYSIGWDPEVVLQKKVIREPGEPHFIPVVYVNNVLFSTIYTFDPEKFSKVMQDMMKIRNEYYSKLYKDLDKGYIVYPNETYIHTKNPLYVNTLISSKEFQLSRKLKHPKISIDPFEELPATRWLIDELERLAVPVTPVGFAEEKKYKVLVLPDMQGIEL